MKPKLLSIIVGVILAAGIAYAIFRKSSEVEPPAGGSTSADVGNSTSPSSSAEGSVPENNLTPQKSSSDDYRKLLTERGKIYENFDVLFRFLYPPDFTIDEIDDEKGLTILAQNSAKKAAFQIFLNPFDEPDPLTPQRIKKDLPNMLIENPQQVLIGAEKNIQAVIFFSQDPSLGKTREVWFVGNGHLFQVETYADQDSVIGPVMDTWEFTN